MSTLETVQEADAIDGILPAHCTNKLIGHTQVFDLLSGQLNDNRLPSGILLHGPKGIGKATLAFQLAKMVLSLTGDETPSRVREQVEAGAHPNLYVLRRVARERGTGFYGEIRVDELRSVLRKLHQTRGRAGHRLLIVDAIDDCNRNSANALLKTLEEPPADTHIVLVSHRPGRLLPTIRSRCQAHGMRPLSQLELKTVLQQGGAEMGQLDKIKNLAGGNPRKGFEALKLGNNQILSELDSWLSAPQLGEPTKLQKLAEDLADKKNISENGFAREVVLDWIAQETQRLARSQSDEDRSVASALNLWGKANELFEQTDAFNLDAKQSLIILFDQIVAHAKQNAPAI